MAKQAIGVWGIDLGQCGLKAIRLVEQDGEVVATAYDFVEHPKILSQPDADPDQLTREALEKFLSRNHLKGDIVAIAVPGQSGLARFVKLPPVEEKKISDIVRFEAKQQIPFPLEEVVWDYQKLGAGMVTDGFALDTEIGLFAMKREMVSKYLTHFKDVGVDVHIVQMAPLALCNYVAFDLLKKDPGGEDEGKKPCVVALDIGTDTSSLVITDGGRIIWQRPIPLGGNHFTRALTKDLKLTFAKAEHLKRNAMKSPDLKKILAAIKPVLSDFVSEVQRSLGYFTNTHRDVQIDYMVGLGNAFRLPGLQRFLSEKLQLEVRKVESLERLKGPGVVDVPVFTENVLSFAVAYGLAVQGLKKARLLTNLLPHEIRTERLIKAKKPWAVAAAAVLLLSVAALDYGYGRQKGAYTSKSIEDAKAQGEKVLKEIDAADKAFSDAKGRADREEKACESIVAGQKEHLNWLNLCNFLDEIVPRPEDAFAMRGPDGKDLIEVDLQGKPILDREGKARFKFNLPESARRYIIEGQEAFTNEWDPWRRGKAQASAKVKDDELGDGLDRLIQFNIVAVSTRFAPDLGAFWSRLDDKVKNPDSKNILPDEDRKKPLTSSEKGWVVELRGFAYHKDHNVFVQDVLMENIARKSAELAAKNPNWPLLTASAKLAAPPAPGRDGTQAPAPAPAAGGAKPVSHVILLYKSTKKADATTPFEVITTTKLDSLVAPAMAPSAPPGGQPKPGGGNQGGSAPPIGGGGAGSGKKEETPRWMSAGGEEFISQPQVPQAAYVAPADGKKPDPVPPRYERTEFVILFVWREPVPSDTLLQGKATAPPPNSGQQRPPGPGGVQGGPPGGNQGGGNPQP